jgi:hypothetical protein
MPSNGLSTVRWLSTGTSPMPRLGLPQANTSIQAAMPPTTTSTKKAFQKVAVSSALTGACARMPRKTMLGGGEDQDYAEGAGRGGQRPQHRRRGSTVRSSVTT